MNSKINENFQVKFLPFMFNKIAITQREYETAFFFIQFCKVVVTVDVNQEILFL